MGSESWAKATANTFDVLRLEECSEAATPEWWNDEALKALSARVLRAALNEESAIDMRANVLSGFSGAWEAGRRSAAELKEAATCFDRSVALCNALRCGKSSSPGERTGAAVGQRPCRVVDRFRGVGVPSACS